VYEGDGVALRKSERRHMQHLVAEITKLAQEALANPSE